MINPSEVGKSGEMVRLRTLESIWVQGKLRMWGRWSYIGGGSGGNMFNQLASGKITKTAINDALRRMKKSGITKPELEAYLREILDSKNKSGLAFCSDEEGLKVDGVIASVLMNDDYRHFMASSSTVTVCVRANCRWPRSLMQNTLTGPLSHAVAESTHG
jgi:hypothetical protein